MHILIKHTIVTLSKSLIIIFFIFVSFNANAAQSVEEIIKARKALFSKNYNTAKKVQALSSGGNFDDARKLMTEMSENYKKLQGMFPENTKKGFKTESLSTIWEEKDNFNSLMDKSSKDMIELASIIQNSDDVKPILGKLMWGNCKACHSKYRAEH